MNALYVIAIVFFILICFFTCLVILAQESKSMGLGASFGGDSGDSVFGTATADILKKLTTWLAVIFMASSVVLSLWTSNLGRTQAETQPSVEMIER